MNLKDFLAIAGYPGLFKYVSQAKNGIIVESLIDKKRMPAYASAKVSALEDIAIFTEDAEVPLGEIFSKIYEKENGGKALDVKSSPDKVIAYFKSVLPDFDQKRVYVSDIKKVISWYNILQELNLLNLPEEKKEETTETEVKEPVKETPKTKAPAAKKSPAKEKGGSKK